MDSFVEKTQDWLKDLYKANHIKNIIKFKIFWLSKIATYHYPNHLGAPQVEHNSWLMKLACK